MSAGDISMSGSTGSDPNDDLGGAGGDAGGAGAPPSMALEAIRQELESIAAQLAEQGADVTAQGADIDAQTKSLADQTEHLLAILRRMGNFEAVLRHELRELDIRVRLGFQGLKGTFLELRNRDEEARVATRLNLDTFMAWVFERIAHLPPHPANFGGPNFGPGPGPGGAGGAGQGGAGVVA